MEERPHEISQSPRRGHRRRPRRRRAGCDRTHRLRSVPALRAPHGRHLDGPGTQARTGRPVRDRDVPRLPGAQGRPGCTEAGRGGAQRPVEPVLPALPVGPAVPRPVRRPRVRGQHLSVTAVEAHHRYLAVEGSVGNVQKALGTTLNRYRHDGTTVRANTGAVTLPTSVASYVTTVTGLDTTPHKVTHDAK